MESAVTDIADRATGGILEQGVMGSFVVLLFAIGVGLLLIILKDKDYQKEISRSFTDMVDVQRSMTKQYETSEIHHKEIVDYIMEEKKESRENIRDCYEKVDAKITIILSKVDGLS